MSKNAGRSNGTGHYGRQKHTNGITSSRQRIADQIHRWVKARFHCAVEAVVIDGKEFRY